MLKKMPTITKTLARNRMTKKVPGMKAMQAMQGMAPSSPMDALSKMTAPTQMMKKGGAAKKPKMGIAIMIAVGKPKGRGK